MKSWNYRSIGMLMVFFIGSSFNFSNQSVSGKDGKPFSSSQPIDDQIKVKSDKYVLVVHGGAGTLERKNFTPEKEKEYTEKLKEALTIGQKILENDGLAIEAVEAVVRHLEDSPLFNAGKGSVYSNSERQEMDASIMDGRDLSSGAVAGISNLKNPITGARIVKDSTDHVFLYGELAQAFCIEKGAEYADSSYFYSEPRLKQLMKAKEKDKAELDHSDNIEFEESKKYGTVGCVALDKYGNLASATSTGGMTNKKYGRIGDSPIIGAGTYADNQTCAISCTGHGEYFIRGTIARDISAIMEFKGGSLKKAGTRTLDKLDSMGGKGGFIGVDRKGNVIMLFNTEGMYRGMVSNSQKMDVEIFGK